MRPRAWAVLLAAGLVASLPGCGPTSVSTEDSRPGGPGCAAVAHPGAPASLGFDVGGATRPVWSADGVGGPTISGRSMYGVDQDCFSARDVSSGRVLWSRHEPADLSGLIASGDTIIGVTEKTEGTAPAAVYDAVNGLVAFAASDGRALWRMPLTIDGQQVPAVISGQTVVVTETNGTVIGLDATTGHAEWTDGRPRGCTPARQDSRGMWPGVVLVDAATSDGAPVIVYYQCASTGPHAPSLAAIDPATGRTDWIDRGVSLEYQSPSTTTAGVVAVVTDGTTAGVPVLAGRTLIPRGYDDYDELAVSEATGRPLWQVGGIPPSAGIYGGAGRLCTVSGFGVACRLARTGAQEWQYRPLGVPSAGGLSGPMDPAATSGRLLYDIVPTAAARTIPRGSTTDQGAPGDFHLEAMDIVTGRVVADLPLPSWWGGSGGVVVSIDSPPAVVANDADDVAVSPQDGETAVTEVFALHSGGK